jgi:histidinol-phosphate/aromatic aminotransferase/cobyric acid decarboxylase-like protein
MKDFIRVTIGTEAENLKFLNALKELLWKLLLLA